MPLPKTQKLVDVNGTYTYIGESLPGTTVGSAQWRIKRIDESSTPDMAIIWANQSADFDKVWDNRLTYSYLP